MRAGVTGMKIDWTYKGVSDIALHVDLSDQVAILFSDSGTGKTFLFQMLASYFVIHGIPYEKFDYSSENKELAWFQQSMKKADVVLLDNADLYMTKALFRDLKSSGKQVVISIKHTERLGSFENCGFYTVDYDGKSLRTVRENCGLIV